MIPNPDNVFEKLQNELATKLVGVAPFNAIKMPDGTNFAVLTEDEGDPEYLFTKEISLFGLSVIVQSPTAKLKEPDNTTWLLFNPLVFAVSVSEMVVFNRDPNGTGTKIRLMSAVAAVISTLHGFVPTCLGQKIFVSRIVKDKDTHPETQQLVASRIVVFESQFKLRSFSLS